VKLKNVATNSFFSRVTQVINEAIVDGENNLISHSDDAHPVRAHVEDAGEVIVEFLVNL
jgi:hypothetical protein